MTLVPVTEAARVRVTKRGRTTRVTVSRGFPIRRTLPSVTVRTRTVRVTVRTRTVRVTPRVYLAPVAFTAVAVVSLPKNVWTTTEMIRPLLH